MRSFDSFTRFDSVMSARHVLSGVLIMFPREIDRVTMTTFRPAVTTPEWHQEGWSAGGVDRLAIVPDLVLESTLSLRHFEIEVEQRQPGADGLRARDAKRRLLQRSGTQRAQLPVGRGVEPHAKFFRGQHVFKFGTDLQRSKYTGMSASRPVEIRRLDGSLAERTEFGGHRRSLSRGPSSRCSRRTAGESTRD